MRTAASSLLIIFFTSMLFALVADCEKIIPSERDGCYLSNARLPDECKLISDIHIRDQCFVSIAETHAQSYRDCDRLYAQYQPLCYARITYLKDKDKLACEQLIPEYKAECYIYYAIHENNHISSCERIPPQYCQQCLEKFFEKSSVQLESDCYSFGEKYQKACADYLNSKLNIFQRTMMFVESSWYFMTSQWTIAAVSLTIFVVILIFGVRMISIALKISKK